MKKALLITLIALMSCMLMTTALAADFTTPGEYVKHVSFDEIRPGIVVAGDDALKNTPTFASGTTELTFWGWAVVGGSNISGFSYSVNGGEKKTDASFVVAAGADVEVSQNTQQQEIGASSTDEKAANEQQPAAADAGTVAASKENGTDNTAKPEPAKP